MDKLGYASETPASISAQGQMSFTDSPSVPYLLAGQQQIERFEQVHSRGYPSGFTLVELVVVVLVLGILAAIAVPAVISNTRDAQATALMQQMNTVADAAEFYYASNGRWPTSQNFNALPGDFAGLLPERAFLSVPGHSTTSGSTPWIQWVYVNSSFVELASVVAYQVEPSVAIALDEEFDDGIINQGAITVGITNGSGGQVASVQYDVTFTIK